jgi:hypothetical protein
LWRCGIAGCSGRVVRGSKPQRDPHWLHGLVHDGKQFGREGPDDRQAVAAAGGLPVAACLAGGADDVAGVVVDAKAVRSNAVSSLALKLVSGGSGPVSVTA